MRKKKSGKTHEEERKHKKKRKSSRRKIGQSDFPLGQGSLSYDLLTDLKEKTAQITFGQLLALSPKLRKEWGKLASTREVGKKKKKNSEGTPMAQKIDIEVGDDVPVVDVIIDGQTISNAYIDGGASINVMSEKTMKDADLKLSSTNSPYRIKLADNTRVRTLGVVKNLEVDVCGISMPTTFQVIPTKPDAKAYPLILGRPWLRKVKAVQKWETGDLILQGRNKKVRYNIKSRHREVVRDESSTFESSEAESTDEEETSGNSEDSTSEGEVEGVAFGLCLGIDRGDTEVHGTLGGEASQITSKQEDVSLRQQNEKLLDDSITGIERENYLQMLDGFPNLFVNSYSQVRQVTLVEHKIDLNPKANQWCRG